LGVVMCGMLLFSATQAGRRKAALCGLLACVVLAALILSPAGAGRPSMWKANILAQGRFEAVYTDAFAVQQLPGSVRDWMVAVGYKFLTNLYLLGRDFAGSRLEGVAMLFLLSGIPLGVWFWQQKRNAFAFGVAWAVTLLLIADLCVYTVWDYRGIRALLLMEPFVAMLWAMRIRRWTRDRGQAVRNLPVLLCFVVGVGVTVSILLLQRDAVVQAKEDTSFLESVIGDSKQMVVSPLGLSLDYVNEHYPQRWAFVPANCPTMQLLDSKEGIGTLIVPAQPGLEAERGSCGTGLKFDGEKVWRGSRYWVFRRETTR
jgi:hypothetical protein